MFKGNKFLQWSLHHNHRCTTLLSLFIAVLLNLTPPVVWCAADQEGTHAEAGTKKSTATKDDQSKNYSETITVHAAPSPVVSPKERGIGFVSVIPRERLASQKGDSSTLLEEEVGVSVARYGGLGLFSFVSIRGSEARQVTYYLDGVPLNSATHGSFNPSLIMPSLLQSVEIYRGSSPPDMGQPGMGGAVNFVTGNAHSERSSDAGSVSIHAGSFETYGITGSISHQFRRVSLYTVVNHQQSEGDFPYLNHNGTPNNRDDDLWVTRQNGDFEANDLLSSLRFQLGAHTQAVCNVLGVLHQQGIPGTESIQSTQAGVSDERLLTTLHISQNRESAIFARWQTTLFWQYYRQLFSDPEQEISITTRQSTERGNRFGFNTSVVFATRHLDLFTVSMESSLDRNRITAEQAGIFASSRNLKERLSWGSSLTYKLITFNSRLALVPSLRFDAASDRELESGETDVFHQGSSANDHWTAVSPQIAALWTVSDTWQFKSALGSYTRFPSLEEKYGDRGTTVGNPELEPETGLSGDLGFMYSPTIHNIPLLLQYAIFFKQSKDLIMYLQNSQYTFRAENIGAAHILGQEFHLRLRTPLRFQSTLSYTWQDCRDRSDIPYYRGNLLPNRPVHELSARFDYGIAPTFFHYSFTFMARNFQDRANRKAVPERVIHNVGIEWRNIIEGLRLTASLNNVTDNQVADLAGYPLPGRSFTFSLTYQW